MTRAGPAGRDEAPRTWSPEMRFGWCVIGASLAGASLAGCADGEPDGGDSKVYHFVTHADHANTFWVTFQRGMDDAAARYEATAKFFGNGGGSARDTTQLMNQRVDDAVAEGVDGIAVTFNDIASQHTHIQAAVDAGIAVIAVNIGYSDEQQALDYPTGVEIYVGQQETVVGAEAVRRAEGLVEGVFDKALCVKGSISQGWAVQRCQGFASRLEDLGFVEESVARDGDKTYAILAGELVADPPVLPGAGGDAGRISIEDWMVENPDVDFVFSTVPSALELILPVVPPDAVVGSVDLSESTTAAIRDGSCDFAIDQQQYLQGYLPIVLFELDRLAVAPVSSATGPSFVDSSNVEEIERLVSEGYR